MNTRQPRKSQRISKACDACHRRKAKCYWRHPSCVDCIRLGLECTFNRSKVNQEQENKVNQEQENEDNPHHEQLVSESGQSQAFATETQTEAQQSIPNISGLAASSQPLQDVMNNNIQELVVFKYFAIENHTFPIFSFAPFHHRLRTYHSGTETPEDDAAWLASLNGVLAACGPHLQLADADFNEATAKRHLETALSYTQELIVREPTTRALQALTCIIACSRHPSFSNIASLNLLAVAIRMAFTLHLHHLDEVMGISAENRLERIRLFWCLYILDKEMALDKNVPPLIDDDDIRVLEPRMHSDDELGLERSLDESKTLNLFVARQRLAQIGSRIWKGLHTFKAQHRPKREQLETTMQLNEELAKWKKEWFQYGQPSDVETAWPKKTIEKLANLQCQYFMCLLKRNFDRPYKAIEMRDRLNTGRELDHQALNLCCVLAARDTLYLTRSIGKGGLPYIFAAMTYVVPAIVMMLSHMCTTTQSESMRKSDLEIVQAWLDVQGFLVERMEQPELRGEYLACQEMFRSAKARAQAESDNFFMAMSWTKS